MSFNLHIQSRRPLTVTECGKCWTITEKAMYRQWAVGPSYDGADNIRYHGRTGAGYSASKVTFLKSEF